MPPDSTTTVPARRHRRRCLVAWLLVAALGYGVASWMAQLTPFERQFVGQWTTTETYPDGSTCFRRLTLHSNHTGHIHTSAHWVGRVGVAPNQEYGTNLSWAIREGRLWFDTGSAASGNLMQFSSRALHRIRNRVFRTACACDHYGVSFGRLSAVRPETFSVNWLTPDFQAEGETLVYARVSPDEKPSSGTDPAAVITRR